MHLAQIGRYEIKSELGRGGMATVYLARDPHFEREVAIKVLPRQFTHDPMFRHRFEREAQTIAALEHPAIVPVHDFGEEDGQPFLVMRYMSGGTLANRLPRGALSLHESASILARIAAALDRAHQLGVIHRDLKPGNILFDQYDEAYLADFGIAKLAEATAVLTGTGIVGTPAYMSPEQVKGEKIDGRSDVYTLGVILFEMLTGQQPYEADTPFGLAFKHVTDPVPDVLRFRADLPISLQNTISQAMSKKAVERFATAGELVASINTAISQISEATAKEQSSDEETMSPGSQETIVDDQPGTQEWPETDAIMLEPPAFQSPMVEPVPEASNEVNSVSVLSSAESRPLPEPLEERPKVSKKLWIWVVGVVGLLVIILLAARQPTPANTPGAETPEGPLVSEFIANGWQGDFRLTELTYGNGVWAAVMSQGNPYGRQTWQTQPDFPSDLIRSKWAEGYQVTSLAYGDGVWAVVMSQGGPYGRQTWQTQPDFPSDLIRSKWAEGYRVTSLAYGDGIWAVVMSQTSPYGRQTWLTDSDF